jgi:uncharacterized protein YkwD
MVHAKAPRLLVPADAVGRVLVALCAVLCALLALPAVGSAGSGARKSKATACANTDLVPDAANVATVRAAVLCLHNRERDARELPPLRENAKLRQAAEGHSENMVRQSFFSHDSPDGVDMADRILRTGYAREQGWSLGENIAWGTGDLATAAEIHRAWMRSPGHKANILRRAFREIGIGISIGAPVDTGRLDGATYTADFGVRR